MMVHTKAEYNKCLKERKRISDENDIPVLE